MPSKDPLPYWDAIRGPTYHTGNNPNGPGTGSGGLWTSGEEGNGASGDNGVPGIIPMECLDLLTGL